MSEREEFIARWLRLKSEAATQADSAELTSQPSNPNENLSAPVAPPPQASAAPGAFDPASLPRIDSITRASDIRQFLQSGVPPELTQAALRAAWRTDPTIRDFVGIAETQWDFNDPTAMPGFGPLDLPEEVRSQVVQRFSLASAGDALSAGALLDEMRLSSSTAPQTLSKVAGTIPMASAAPPQMAPKSAPDGDEPPRGPRLHGSALPRLPA